MAVPLGNDARFVSFHHPVSIEHDNDGPVCLVGTSAYIDNRKIPICDLFVFPYFGETPNPQLALRILREL